MAAFGNLTSNLCNKLGEFKMATRVNGRRKQIGCNFDGHIFRNKCGAFGEKGAVLMSAVANSSNIVWQKCPVEKSDSEELLNQKGCVVLITGLSGSGKSTLACALSHSLHARGKLTYILDGDNCRHGLNRDLSFKAEDRAENIRQIGEVAKLFADAGVICIASLISPFRKERDACRALLKLEILSRFFTGVDDPYEPPLKSEIVLYQREGIHDSPTDLAEIIVSYLETKGYLEA